MMQKSTREIAARCFWSGIGSAEVLLPCCLLKSAGVFA